MAKEYIMQKHTNNCTHQYPLQIHLYCHILRKEGCNTTVEPDNTSLLSLITPRTYMVLTLCLKLIHNMRYIFTLLSIQ